METHWDIAITMPDATTTHVACGCGWHKTLTHGAREFAQVRAIRDARRDWWDHDCAGRPFVIARSVA